MALALSAARASVVINETNFPDEWFRWSIQNLDEDGDGTLSDAELAAVDLLYLYDAVNFKGIEYFYHVSTLFISGLNADEDNRGKVTSFDFNKFANLEYVEFSDYRYVTSLDFSQNTKLKTLRLLGATSLNDVKVPTSLEIISLRILPKLTAIDLTPCKSNLQQVYLETWGEDLHGGLKQLDLTDFKKLDFVEANGGPDNHYPMEQLILKGCTAMNHVTLDWVDVDNLALENLPTIVDVHITNCAMKMLKVDNCGELVTLTFQDNDIAEMNVKKCEKLRRIHANNNRLQVLTVDESPNFWWLQAAHNRLMWLDMSGVVKDPNNDDTENVNFEVDDQQPLVQAVKISPTEVGLRVHERLDVTRVLNLRAKGIAQTPKEIFVDGIRYFVFYDNGPDTPNLVGSDCYYEYETKWPWVWREGNTKDNRLPVTLNVTSWTKHQAFLTLSKNRVEGKYGEPAPAAPIVTRSQDYDGKITFSSSNENVVKVNPDTGELTVVGAGTAIISVTGAETDYRLAPAVKTYTVFIDKATPVIAFPAAEINATYGETVPLNQLTVTWYEGTVTYSSANEKKAVVDAATGVVTTKGAGDVVIKGIAPETSNFYRAEVNYTLHIAKASPVFAFEKNGLTVALGAAVPENKLNVGLYDGEVQYVSSDETVATVDAQGVVTTLAIGEVTITATGAETENCNEAKKADYTLTVADPSGISGIAADAVSTGKAYDLQGRKVNVQTARKGVYVVGGKKMVMK